MPGPAGMRPRIVAMVATGHRCRIFVNGPDSGIAWRSSPCSTREVVPLTARLDDRTMLGTHNSEDEFGLFDLAC